MQTLRFLRRAVACLLVVSLTLEPVLAQLPELGDPASAALSPSRERRIGAMAMRQIRQDESSYIDDPEIEYYLNSLGRRLVQASGFPPQDFNFFALNDNTVNAFAMPGGYIGVHSGLVTLTQGESELAGVLAHEIGHVEQKHIVRMVDSQGAGTIALVAGLLVALLVGGRGKSGGDIGQAAVMSGQAAMIQNQLSFSQSFEREADRVGFQTLNAAGFDIRGMENFFERLARVAGSERSDTAFLRTHPLTSERIADMQGRASMLVPHSVADSNDYVLTRAKLDAMNGTPRDALLRIQSASAPRRQDQAARWYAIARVQLRQKNPAEAAKALAQLRSLRFESPLVEMLAADVASAQGQVAQAAAICEAALQRYPAAHYLQLSRALALIEIGQADLAAQLARDAIVDAPGDVRWHVLLSKAYAAQGKTADQQRAQAELFVLNDDLEGAIQQLRLAQRSGAGDYFTQSAIDARLRELRAKQKEKLADKLE
ncbi:M48 family metalloprotease [Uliginosibacterium sediminicola]|uniref:M48 family metalloprotease n=1 Tax=Uliginosibacterium sediminicola TaxID=2024550 RepID=A0ABU9Z422_9RHOO